MVKVGIPGTRQHGALSQRDIHSLSHPGLYIEGGLGLKGIAMGYNLRSAGGDQAITGVGFTPKLVIFLAYCAAGTYRVHSEGFDDGVNHYERHHRGDVLAGGYMSTRSIYLYIDASNNMNGYISSMGADGFTITWALTGTITAYIVWIALQ